MRLVVVLDRNDLERIAEPVDEDGAHWMVPPDPEGNEPCVPAPSSG